LGISPRRRDAVLLFRPVGRPADPFRIGGASSFLTSPTHCFGGTWTMLALLLASLAIGLEPASFPATTEPLPFDVVALKALPQVELKVTEDGKSGVYSGVPLASLLTELLKGDNEMASLRALADAVILVEASDGYQVAVSAAAVAMDPKGERYFLALQRDGKPLDAKQGPARLVIPGDPKHLRWIRMIKSFELIRLKTSK
ncbi:molybdopterin-dependent oxidoreductase, partial [Singulisphaera rosea]